MDDIPDIIGSKALWAVFRSFQIGSRHVFAFDNLEGVLFLGGVGVTVSLSVYMGYLDFRRHQPPALTTGRVPRKQHQPPSDTGTPGKSSYRRLCMLYTDPQERERRIADLMDAEGLTRIEAINMLVSPHGSGAAMVPNEAEIPDPGSTNMDDAGPVEEADPFGEPVAPAQEEPPISIPWAADASLDRSPEFDHGRSFEPVPPEPDEADRPAEPEPLIQPEPPPLPMPALDQERAEFELARRIPNASVREQLCQDRLRTGQARSRHEAVLQLLGMSRPSEALHAHIWMMADGSHEPGRPDHSRSF